MAGTDDSNDSAITRESLSALNTGPARSLDAPQSTPEDLKDWFG
jgi:hypothetical protein